MSGIKRSARQSRVDADGWARPTKRLGQIAVGSGPVPLRQHTTPPILMHEVEGHEAMPHTPTETTRRAERLTSKRRLP